MNKIRKILLASTMVLGGISIADVTNTSTTKAEVRENVGVTAAYSSPANNVFRTTLFISGNSSNMTDVKTKHIPVFAIKNSSGILAKEGSLSTWVERTNPLFDLYEFDSISDINLSTLPPGNYRIQVTIPMDDGSINSSVNKSFTRAFTLNPDRTVTNVRP
ncbi:hypothetical protein [Pseudobacillus wudalianchiensis]|uniref:NEAT domain-containing protein n=1 Tax=Pseudobacillus wudalianchiensis TaxID=1743143 RepID=A0A1B9BA17_9BACI|nr:hypothetical protein [Bacillus wudalianchiensis]OCA92940.1 hypothetical protein A8F95_04455 [Bacillus wudalianchiensis]